MSNDKIKAYLNDGRHIKVPAHAVTDWQYEVQNDDTTRSLGDWYTDGGDLHTDKIEGSVDDENLCDHEESTHRIANQSQLGDYQKDKPLRMLRTCHRRACILDGLAWVERGTGETAAWAPPHGEFRFCAPDKDQSTNFYQLPMDPTAAREALDDGEEFLTVELLVNIAEILNDIVVAEDTLIEDAVHHKAFTFGLDNESAATIIGVSGDHFLVEYTTNIAHSLAVLDGEAG